MTRLVPGFASLLMLGAVLSGCTDGSHPQARPSEPPRTTAEEPPSASPSPSAASSPAPIPPGGVLPNDPDGFADVVAHSLVAVVSAGRIEFVDRILGDANSSSTCTPLPDIFVLSKTDAAEERGLVRASIRAAEAIDRVDGIGHARGRMNPGAEWPGVDDPFVVAVVLAIDCPEEGG